MQSLAEAYTCPSKGIGSPTRTIPPKQREGNAKRTDGLKKRERQRAKETEKIRSKGEKERENEDEEIERV